MPASARRASPLQLLEDRVPVPPVEAVGGVRLEPGSELADDLLARTRANVSNDADEVMWGTPGTLLRDEQDPRLAGEERSADVDGT